MAINPKITLDHPVRYRIKVPGQLDDIWSEWAVGMTLKVDFDSDGIPTTTLTGTFDQAALHGMLRRLYSRGLPLLSVKCIASDTDTTAG